MARGGDVEMVTRRIAEERAAAAAAEAAAALAAEAAAAARAAEAATTQTTAASAKPKPPPPKAHRVGAWLREELQRASQLQGSHVAGSSVEAEEIMDSLTGPPTVLTREEQQCADWRVRKGAQKLRNCVFSIGDLNTTRRVIAHFLTSPEGRGRRRQGRWRTWAGERWRRRKGRQPCRRRTAGATGALLAWSRHTQSFARLYSRVVSVRLCLRVYTGVRFISIYVSSMCASWLCPTWHSTRAAMLVFCKGERSFRLWRQNFFRLRRTLAHFHAITSFCYRSSEPDRLYIVDGRSNRLRGGVPPRLFL